MDGLKRRLRMMVLISKKIKQQYTEVNYDGPKKVNIKCGPINLIPFDIPKLDIKI